MNYNPGGSSWNWVKRGVLSLHQKPSLWAVPVLDCGARFTIWGLAWYLVVSGWIDHGIRSAWVLSLIPAWLLASFVKAYFSVALAHALLVKDEEDALLDAGLAHAGSMKWQIAKWGWLNSVASLILNINSTRGLFGQVLTALGGMSWKMATLITPVLLAQGRKPWAAIEKSAEIVMSRLGGAAVSTAGLWGAFQLIQGAVSFLGFVGIWALIMTGYPIVGVAVGLGAGIVILGIRAYEAAVMIAFAVELLDEHEAS